MIALLITLFLPLAGAILLLFFNRNNPATIKNTALITSILAFIASLFILFEFDSNNPNFQLLYQTIWIQEFDAGFRIGVDGMSMLLVLLTTFITPITIFASPGAITKREKEYYIMMLFLQFAMTGVFVSLDLFLFYIFWELILIPMYFIDRKSVV